MSPRLHDFLGAYCKLIVATVFSREDVTLILLLLAALSCIAFLLYRSRERSRARQSRNVILGKRVSEFVERLAVSPVSLVEATILDGLDSLVGLVDTDRICWYELDEASSTLLHKYTASARPAPPSPKNIPPHATPSVAGRLAHHQVIALHTLKDLPPEAASDAQFLRELGVKSLLLIPSSYSPTRKGVLALASYTKEVIWLEEATNQLAIAANIIGATLERKYAQVAIEESERRFRSLFAQASIGIALESLEGQILDVNPAFCAMIGYTKEDLQNATCSRISHPDDEQIEMVLLDELRQGLRSSYRIEKRFFRKDGSQMWGQVSVSLLNRNQESAPLIIGMVSDVTAQKDAEAGLHLRDQELQRLAGSLIEAQEDERRRISRELHDDIGQRLALLVCELDIQRAGKASLIDQDSRTDVRKELDSIATDIHELSHELHSASLKTCGIKVALKDLCWKYSHNHSLQIDLHAEEPVATLPPDVALCLFRVAQEALANAVKHGHAKKVLVLLAEDHGQLRLTIKDFGIGFDSTTQSTGIGLISMRERLRLCGGNLLVISAPAQGTEIKAELPVHIHSKKLVASAS
jgi:PAS domain S-box-containing protein